MKITWIILLLLFLSACSYGSEFYIYNLSGQRVTITYTLGNNSSSGIFDASPQIYTLEDFGKKSIVTSNKNRSGIYDPKTKMVIVELDTNEALRLGSANNFTLSNVEERKRVFRSLKNLVITTASRDSIVCAGGMVHMLFSELDDNIFGIKVE